MGTASTNSLGNGIFNPAIWAREMQDVFERSNVAIQLANTDLRDQLSVGDTVKWAA
ncbi:MAG: hypothetical protein M0R06_06935 [Sphaerochaeta sp.]|jgi:hypothetical protein|nr:hypothetical protein [Sphaerochaeta sp.]